jgi:hypothetical protein
MKNGLYSFKWDDKNAISFLRDDVHCPVAYVFCVGADEWKVVFNKMLMPRAMKTRQGAKDVAEKGAILLLNNMVKTLAYFMEVEFNAGSKSKQ